MYIAKEEKDLKTLLEMHPCNITPEKYTYKNQNEFIMVTCNECGHQWMIKPAYIVGERVKCRVCEKKKVLEENKKIRHDRCLKTAIECAPEGITVIDVFETGRHSMHVKLYDTHLDNHGRIYGERIQPYYSFIQGYVHKAVAGANLAVTTEEWIKKAKNVHPEYDYSKTVYTTCHKSVTIICPKHGEFTVSPKVFIKPDYKCAKCKKEECLHDKWEEYKQKASEVHKNKYIYPDQDFLGVHHYIRIICPKHGEFLQDAHNHLSGANCKKCVFEQNGEMRTTTFDEFVEKARKVHGDKYTYHRNSYTRLSEKTTITCQIHGDFVQIGKAHTNGAGCPMCHGLYTDSDKATANFIKRAKAIHGNKYDYSKTVYRGRHEKLTITCHAVNEFGEEHGDFEQLAGNHLHGYGCQKCGGRYLDRDLFIKKANKIHNGIYDYSKSQFASNKTKVAIICPEHGEFLQTPNCHMSGQGCPLCKTSHLERTIDAALKQLNRLYTYQYHNKSVFGQQSLDFYLGAIKLGIECQGEQHYIANFFKSKGMDYAEEHLKYIQELDEKKRVICKEQGIELVYFQEKKFNQFIPAGQKVFNDVKDLVRYIESKFNSKL